MHKIFLAQTVQEGPFQVMFVETQQAREQKELNASKRKGQDDASNFFGQ